MTLAAILLGALITADLTIGLFFLRFWKKTHDRFFLYFSLSFCLDGIDRIAWIFLRNEAEPLVYVLRLIAYLIIICAIVDKNWGRRKT